MRTYFFILTGLFITGCINQKVTEQDVFNPIKEYKISDTFTVQEKLISKNDSIELETWYLTMPEALFNLIYLSGNGSNIRSAIPFFNSFGKQTRLNIFSFNYSGYGLSTGTPSINGIIEDATVALRYFSAIKNNELPTLLMGYSLGGYVALTLSNESLIDKVIVLSTFSSAQELEEYLKKEALPAIARPILKIDVDEKVYSLNNIDNVKKIKKPLLVIHGQRDDFIPPKMGKKLYDLSISERKYFIEIDGADHRSILKEDEKSSQVAYEIIHFVQSNQLSNKFYSNSGKLDF